MKPFRIILNVLVACALLFSQKINAFESNNSSLEGKVPCAEGTCVVSKTDFRVPIDREQLLHMVNIFANDGIDPRHIQSRISDQFMYAPIGKIETLGNVNYRIPGQTEPGSGVGHGTGFLISPCYAVTNFHVAFGDFDKSHDWSKKYYVKFEVGPGRDDSFKYKLLGRVEAYGPYDITSADSDDWVVILLNECVGADPKVGFFETASLDLKNASLTPLTLAGYPADKLQSELWAHHRCSIHRGDGFEFEHDCASRPGASGAPILVEQNGVMRVVGVNVGEFNPQNKVLRKYESSKANKAINLDRIFNTSAAVSKWVADDKIRKHKNYSDQLAADI